MARRISRQPIATLATALLIALLAIGADQPLTLEQRAVLDHISADSLRGHLSFIASDALEGRDTPSRGLDLAAEYIAAQFRRAGLEPVGDDGYYQTADMLEVEPVQDGFEMTITQAGNSISIRSDEITRRFQTALDIVDKGTYKLDSSAHDGLKNLKPEDVQDRVVVTELPNFSGTEASDAGRQFRELL